MDESDRVPKRTRGTAILVMTLILVSVTVGVYFLGPRNGRETRLPVRVAVIDSGISPDSELEQRIVAERSFIQEGYGYDITDNTTADSTPSGIQHGSIVSRIIIENSENAMIVNAKVVTGENQATVTAIVDAIRWAVEENCSVINLSLGGTATNHDSVGDAALWAFNQGVVVVAAAGNNGQGGVAGSSIETPAQRSEVIAVGAVDENLQPFAFSGRGPLRNGLAKPDIVALGYYNGAEGTVFGTSFAAPRVAAAAAEIVTLCYENRWRWTPGMVKALLLASSRNLKSQVYEVGSGLVDVEAAEIHLQNTPKRDGLPLVAWIMPTSAPYDFERWFVNSTHRIAVSVYTSSNDTWFITYSGSGYHHARGPGIIEVNQTSSLDINVHVISDRRIEDVRIQITLSSPDYRYIRCNLQFQAEMPIAKIAFDVSHTPWSIDSIYGQFREFYEIATDIGIAVEEILWPSNITLPLLLEYDAVVILDPCAYDTFYLNDTLIRDSRRYTSAEIIAYREYWESGRGLFIVGMANDSIDLSAANALLSQFGMVFNHDRLPQTRIVMNNVESTISIDEFMEHPVTQGIDSIDYSGCSINIVGNAFPLAWTTVRVENGPSNKYENRTVIAGLLGEDGARLICSGSNYFVDNWALLGRYSSDKNSRFVRQILFWLIGLT